MQSAKLSGSKLNIVGQFLGALLLAGLVVCAAQAHELPMQSQLRGRVLDPNRAAIAGALITTERKGFPAASARSNADGEFSLSLEPGEYTLKISADGPSGVAFDALV